MKSVLFLLASSRVNGNSELLAREAAKGLPATLSQTWLRLSDYPLKAFADVRHAGERYFETPTGHAKVLMEATLAADVLVFSAPVYWYSLPAPAKLYLDHWSHWMRISDLGFRARMRGKTMYLTTTMAGNEPSEAEPLIHSLQLTASYMGMKWGGHVLAHANAAGDVLQQQEILNSARRLLSA